ncbi:MAG: hypothetical protein NWR72_15890 [Bacteroidia bacterium]|jgi:hypothetical protein|nr:hypothetical protein [Bacteroidia bacterium]
MKLASHFQGTSAAFVLSLEEGIVQLRSDGECVLPSGAMLRAADLHPADVDAICNRWKRWLKACFLRKQELAKLEYEQWLRMERETAINGMVESLEGSAAHLYYEALLPIIREEINQSDNLKPEETTLGKVRVQAIDLVKLGRLGDAIELVSECVVSDPDQRYRINDLIHLQSELAHLNDGERKGVLPIETIKTGRNQLLNALLGILDEIAPS